MTGPASLLPGESLAEYGARYTAAAVPVPAPWDCQCGPRRNSALIESCPTCGTLRPYPYTPPEITTADDAEIVHGPGELPEDYPRPDETPEAFAQRMAARTAALADTPVPVPISREPDVAPLALGSPGRGPGHYAAVTFRMGKASIAIDPVVLQLVMETANKAAIHGGVHALDVTVDSPTRVRLTLSATFDRTGDALPHVVQDDG